MRPWWITILSIVLGLLWLLNWIGVIASFSVFEFGRVAWIVSTQVLAGVYLIGLWRMEIWGPILYLVGQAAAIAAWYLFPIAGAEDVYPIWAIVLAPAVYALLTIPFWRRFKPFRRIEIADAGA